MIPALMCDLDGTLALNNSGRPWFGDGYEARIYEDDVNPMVNRFLEEFYGNGVFDHIVFVSGRMEVGRDETVRWLHDKADWYMDDDDIHLFMRADGDKRLDTIVKHEIYERDIAPIYDIKLALDDRPEIVALWRSMGIECWQVADYR